MLPIDPSQEAAISALPDEAVVDISVNIENPTPEQLAVIAKFKDAVVATNAAIKRLPDHAAVTLTDGRIVTGAELKAIWATMDFRIDPSGTQYANGTSRGEAVYENGDARANLNIDLITQYSALTNGLNYLIIHEFSHMSRAATDYYASLNQNGMTATEAEARERYTDDLARAIAISTNLPFLVAPYYGFNTVDPLFFSTDDDGGSGPGGGGGGWPYVAPQPF